MARLDFLYGRPSVDHSHYFGLARVAARLHTFPRSPAGHEALLGRYLEACLIGLERDVAAEPDLAPLRGVLPDLCRLARTALAEDADDRPLLERERSLGYLPGALVHVAGVPGRVVWLAAMVRSVPDEEGPAAIMLVNDLASADFGLPLRALGSTLGVGCHLEA